MCASVTCKVFLPIANDETEDRTNAIQGVVSLKLMSKKIKRTHTVRRVGWKLSAKMFSWLMSVTQVAHAVKNKVI
jgi:hypothetical protein